ncbi:MAG: n-acetylglutamate synthase [Bacteroidota bacterium]
MSARPLNYDGRRFASVATSDNGDVDGATRFDYRQRGDVVWATYQGGGVKMGTLIATVDARGGLDMRYQHVDAHGEIRTGTCLSVPEVLPDGRLRLHETWQWTSGDRSSGTSTLEEI